MNGSLADRVAIITGATGGIGGAVAKRLAEAGATCLLLGRNRERGERVQAEVAKIGSARFEPCDVSDASDVDRIVALVKETYGRADVLVNNAGLTRDGLLMRMKEEDWDIVLDTNLKSMFLLTRGFTSMMTRARWGRIINITSVVGLAGNAGQANYAASKAGVVGFTKAVAKELAARGITVNAIAPGFIETGMTEKMDEKARDMLLGRIAARRFGSPEDVAPAVHFFASPEAAYITGQVLTVDGCLSI